MNQIPLKAHYVNGQVEGLAEFQPDDTISLEHLGLRLDAWLEQQEITSMSYDASDNLEWVYFATGHAEKMYYDNTQDDILTHVEFYKDIDTVLTLIHTLNINYDLNGNLISTSWVTH